MHVVTSDTREAKQHCFRLISVLASLGGPVSWNTMFWFITYVLRVLTTELHRNTFRAQMTTSQWEAANDAFNTWKYRSTNHKLRTRNTMESALYNFYSLVKIIKLTHSQTLVRSFYISQLVIENCTNHFPWSKYLCILMVMPLMLMFMSLLSLRASDSDLPCSLRWWNKTILRSASAPGR